MKEPGVAAAAAWVTAVGSDSAPGPGTAICCGAAEKGKKKRKMRDGWENWDVRQSRSGLDTHIVEFPDRTENLEKPLNFQDVSKCPQQRPGS